MTNEISLSGGSNYELNDTVTISHGAITGITCRVDEIETTITTADVSISGGTGFSTDDTLSFAYGDLSGTATVTGTGENGSITSTSKTLTDASGNVSTSDTPSFTVTSGSGSNPTGSFATLSGSIQVFSVTDADGNQGTLSSSNTTASITSSNTSATLSIRWSNWNNCFLIGRWWKSNFFYFFF